jgi:hypothetical protein
MASQRVCSSGLGVADLPGGWAGEPTSWQGTWVHVPSAICWLALQEDDAGGSAGFGVSACLASAGIAIAASAAVTATTIAFLIRIEGSPVSKGMIT